MTYDVEENLLNERAMMLSILQKNSVKIPVETDYCPDCKHENKVQEEYNNPKLENQEVHTTQVESESVSESEVESIVESISESLSESESESLVESISESVSESESESESTNETQNNVQQEQTSQQGSVPLFF